MFEPAQATARDKRTCIVAENISKTFSRRGSHTKPLLQGLDLRIAFGEIVGITGASGSGKTTLGDILLGLVRPEGGRIQWAGRDRTSLTRAELRDLRPKYQKIYQDPFRSFPPWLTIRETLTDVLAYHGLTRGPSDTERRLRRAAREVMVPEDLLDRSPGRLSGGEIQRLALARALLLEPFFLVADEPTSRLDPSVQALVARLIMRVAGERNMAVLFISHDAELLKVVCHRVFALEKGKLHARTAWRRT